MGFFDYFGVIIGVAVVAWVVDNIFGGDGNDDEHTIHDFNDLSKKF